MNFLEPPFIYYLVLGIAIGVGIILFRRFKIPTKSQKFEGQTLNEVIENENLEPYLKAFGRKTKKGKLIYNGKSISIRRMVNATFSYKDVKYSKYTKDIHTLKGKFIIFQSMKSKFSKIPIINIFIGKPVYYIVKNDINTEKETITKDSYRDVWVLSPSNYFYSIAGVWVNSIECKDFINELIYKKIFENIKTEDMNYPKRIVWYNDIYASRMTSTEQAYELEKKKWNDKVERETGIKNKE